MTATVTTLLAGSCVLIGAILGLAGRSRIRARRPPLFWVGVGLLGLVLRLAADATTTRFAAVGLIAGFGLLIVFCLKNLAWPGMLIAALGFAASGLCIAANGGMPIGNQAARSAGIVVADQQKGDSTLMGGRHLEAPEDRLLFLGEIIPIRALKRTFSFGEFVALAGMANVAFHVTGRRSIRSSKPPRKNLPPHDDPPDSIAHRLNGLTVEDTGEFVRVVPPGELVGAGAQHRERLGFATP